MIIVFDVNETLLDLRALDAPFAALMGEGAREAWFEELLRRALVTTVTGPYVDFGRLADAALQVTAARRSAELNAEERADLLAGVRSLPPHDDVAEALGRLRSAGFRLVALSNGTPDALADQLDHAGLASAFDRIVSAEIAGRLKPAPEPYRAVAEMENVPVEDLCMVAAHAWDVAGALRAGARAAFVARPGKRLAATDPEPDVIAEDLSEAADAIIARFGGNG